MMHPNELHKQPAWACCCVPSRSPEGPSSQAERAKTVHMRRGRAGSDQQVLWAERVPSVCERGGKCDLSSLPQLSSSWASLSLSCYLKSLKSPEREVPLVTVPILQMGASGPGQ